MDVSLQSLSQKTKANPVVAVFVVIMLAACAVPLIAARSRDTGDTLFVGERVRAYGVSVRLDKEGRALVQEDVTYDYGNQQKAGFVRALPRKASLKAFTSEDREIGFQFPTRNGSPEPIASKQTRAQVSATIGDARRRITGTQEYRLAYQIDRFVIRTETADVVRWSPTDVTFGIPVDTASGSLESPVAPVRASCRIGTGADTPWSACDVTTVGTTSRFSAPRRLEPGEGVFLELGYPKGTFADPLVIPPARGVPAWIIVVLIHGAIISAAWLLIGRDEKGRGTIVPDATLLNEVSAYEAGALLAQRPSYASFIGMLLDLAQRGAITFTRVEIQKIAYFDIERGRGQYGLDPVEKEVLKRLFRYTTSDDPNDEEADTVRFRRDSEEVRLAYRTFETLVYKRLQRRGWYAQNILLVQTVGAVTLAAWTYALSIVLRRWIADPSLVWMNIQTILFLPFIYFLPRLTRAGALAREKVQGLAWYIRVAEKERLAFHEGPDTLFAKPETLVAYAVAMGMQKDWEKQFSEGYREMKKDSREKSST